MQITIDTELRSLIPALSPEEFKQLEANIEENGCLDPLRIWKTDGKNLLIDGHNRYKICEKLGKRYQTTDIELEDRVHAKLWIAENQLGRRNLSDDQRSIIANEIREMRSEIAKAQQRKEAGAGKPLSNQRDSGGDRASSPLSPTKQSTSKPQERTRAAVAKEANLPERKLRSAQELKKKAPELADKVREGSMTMAQAKKEVRKKETREQKAVRPATMPDLDMLENGLISVLRNAEKMTDATSQFLKATPDLGAGAKIKIKEIIKLLRDFSKKAAKYADTLEDGMRG